MFVCVFSGCFYRHYMPLYTISRGIYLNDSAHLVTRHVRLEDEPFEEEVKEAGPRNHYLNSFGNWL